MIDYSPPLKQRARRLRSEMTDAEHKLWFTLRRKSWMAFLSYRQKPIGPYSVDFYLPAIRLVIEVDGSQHLTEAGMPADPKRTAYLQSVGLKVIRFDNRQILLETPAVLEVIWGELIRRR